MSDPDLGEVRANCHSLLGFANEAILNLLEANKGLVQNERIKTQAEI
jgi:hypothetical protein